MQRQAGSQTSHEDDDACRYTRLAKSACQGQLHLLGPTSFRVQLRPDVEGWAEHLQLRGTRSRLQPRQVVNACAIDEIPVLHHFGWQARRIINRTRLLHFLVVIVQQEPLAFV